jgi:hypothetical protein
MSAEDLSLKMEADGLTETADALRPHLGSPASFSGALAARSFPPHRSPFARRIQNGLRQHFASHSGDRGACEPR